MIEVRELTKRFGQTVAVDGLTFTVKPGYVTGFLGPNGAGKSTTMRAVLGLDRPTSGVALVNGRDYQTIQRPMHHVGALLDAGTVHGGRSAYNHLRCLARSNGIGRDRVAAVLEQVGLAGVSELASEPDEHCPGAELARRQGSPAPSLRGAGVARKRIKGFSLGMRQRLGIAAALLGDPGVLLFDEPVNGLDPEGIRWIRELMRTLAAEGRTVLISSHLMSEMALTADLVVVIGRGRLIAETSVDELARQFRRDVLIRSPRRTELTGALNAAGAVVLDEPDGGLAVTGVSPAQIADIALVRRIPIHELTPRSASLEEAYLHLTEDSVEYRSVS